MFETIYNWFLEAIQALVSTISSVLPHSPFVSFIDCPTAECGRY